MRSSSTCKNLRERARQEIEKGPVTAPYGADLDRVIAVLNAALATELVCVLRYKQHHYAAKGLHAEPVAQEFLLHATEEQDHADRLAARITQLGGTPDFNPDADRALALGVHAGRGPDRYDQGEPRCRAGCDLLLHGDHQLARRR